MCDCLKNRKHYNSIVLDTKFTGSVEKIYNLLFTDGFVRRYLIERERCTNINISEWISDPDDKLTRTSSFNWPTGPKCYLKDECLHRDFDGYVTCLTTTNTPDLPYGSYFSVKTRTCIMWAGANETRVIVTAAVEFLDSTWFKVRSLLSNLDMIEKAALDGQKQYHKQIALAIRRYIAAEEGGLPVRGVNEVMADSETQSSVYRSILWVVIACVLVYIACGLVSTVVNKFYNWLGSTDKLSGDVFYESQRLRVYSSMFDDAEGDHLWVWISEKHEESKSDETNTSELDENPSTITSNSTSENQSSSESNESNSYPERRQKLKNHFMNYFEHFDNFGDRALSRPSNSRRHPLASSSVPPTLDDIHGQIEDLQHLQRLVHAAQYQANKLADIAEEERAYLLQLEKNMLNNSKLNDLRNTQSTNSPWKKCNAFSTV
ncbi:9582_t:CDS:2 [Ambispora gerdemannii]|uniref:9582_t:CDS:1 n=1 Tax=Ambispora gerdemannii TaxID=144530 RepID=A0A9N8ZR74_9GLOM|nr:9582_t:CDS:2 [Ambispora gerdemannii]